jgi:hypothetical protein
MPDGRINHLMCLILLLGLFSVGGCNASGPEPAFQTTYSAIGAQVK